ncbi:MAG: DUF2917 domain-containing protein [Burkholderiales bacterium]
MNINLNEAAVNLTKNHSLEICNGAGRRILCTDGVVWITQEYDTRDLVLKPGESFVLDRPGLTLVTAMDDAQLRIEERQVTLGGINVARRKPLISETLGHLRALFAPARLNRC